MSALKMLEATMLDTVLTGDIIKEVIFKEGEWYYLLTVDEADVLVERGVNQQPLNCSEFSGPLSDADLLYYLMRGKKTVDTNGRGQYFWEVVKEALCCEYPS